MKKLTLLLLSVAVLLVILLALFTGRFAVNLLDLLDALANKANGTELTLAQEQAVLVMLGVRLPRILAALVIGASLATSGTAYQALFLNPLVSPGILGVLAGAAFGASVGIVLFPSTWLATQLFAFTFACAAVALSMFFARLMRKSSLLVLILGGMVSTSFFTSLTALLKFVADPNRQLPELVYWLMGTLSRIDGFTLALLGPPMLACIIVLCMHGKNINALSMGDDEARALGVPVKKMRLGIIALATFISGLSVVLVGIIGWVGLVIPHMLRFILGPDNRVLLPASALGGAIFLVATDTLTRTLFSAELPIGVFTSLISLPLFVFSLRYSKGAWK